MKNIKASMILPLGLLLLSLLFSINNCSHGSDRLSQTMAGWETTAAPGRLTALYPAAHTVFPPEITAPTVTWEDKTPGVNAWRVGVFHQGKQLFLSPILTIARWQANKETWDALKQTRPQTPSASGHAADLRVVIAGIDSAAPDTPLSGVGIPVHISRHPVEAAIFYRDVPLPFEFAYKNLHTIRWRLADISSSDEAPVVLSDLPLCGNCHSFTRDGQTMAMDVDYANDKGSYVISKLEKTTVLTPDKIITWSDYHKKDNQQTFGLLSQISPDGRYAVSTVKDRSIFVPRNDLYYSQLFFPIKGILAYYDRTAKTFAALPGADDPKYVHSSASWSPDGKYLIFARAEAYHSEAVEKSKQVVLPPSVALEFTRDKKPFKFDLYRIPFNEGKGGTAEPVPGASANNKSNYFPRISPDGKWIVFCQADNYMLLQPDSKLHIMPATGGEPREMNCNSLQMNSWHSWSPNSRWLVFASKAGGPYTQLYLTHIDEQGNDSPPVLLEHLVIPERAANIPEFVNLKDKHAVPETIVNQFTDSGNYMMRMGGERMYARDYKGAIEIYDKVAAEKPNFARVYLKRGEAYYKIGDLKGALDDTTRALALSPSLAEAYKNRGNIKLRQKDYKGAMDDYNRALTIRPDYLQALARRAGAKYEIGDIAGAFKDIDDAIAKNPEDFIFYNDRGAFHMGQGQFKEAEADFSQAIKWKPEEAALYFSRGDVRFKLKNLDGAIEDYDRGLKLNPKAAEFLFKRGMVKVMTGKRDAGLKDLEEADKLGFKAAAEQIRRLKGDR